MSREDRKRRRSDRQKTTQRSMGLDKNLKPTLPPPDFDPRTVTDSEMYGTVIHPMFTGLGHHVRMSADEDWVDHVMLYMRELGERKVLEDMIELLVETLPLWNIFESNMFPAPGEYPKKKCNRVLPMPSVDVVAKGERWTAELVRGMMQNPVLTGMPPFPEIIPRDRYLDVIVKMAHNREEPGGMPQILVNILFLLKYTYGAPGQSCRHIPIGYKKAGEAYGDQDDDFTSNMPGRE